MLNTYPAGRLARVLRDYGEERFARRIADAVVRERARAPLSSTAQLAEIVRDSIPAPARRTGGNPGQADLPGAAHRGQRRAGRAARARCPAPWTRLAVGGRIVVLAYHSLEDRAVKTALAQASADTTPPGLPVPLESARPRFRLLTRGAQRPSAAELAANPRAASPGCGPPSGSGTPHDRRAGTPGPLEAAPSTPETEHQEPVRSQDRVQYDSTEAGHHGAGQGNPAARGTRE